MALHVVDIGLISGYFLAILVLGIYKTRSHNSSTYMVMGRKLTLPAFVMTLVSTWYGGILGVSEYSTTYGVSNWVIFGLPYYVFGILFGLFVAKRARALEVSSLPEILARDYGLIAGRLASIWVLLLASPAPYILTLGIILNYFFAIELVYAIILGTVFSLLYIFHGGLTAVIKTDQLQFVFMFIGFLAMLVVLWLNYMGPMELWRSLPDSHTSWSGGQSIGYILVWFFIGSWTLVDPGFHQRVYATTSPKTAQNGIYFAVGFWFIFDFLTTLTGLYAFSLLSQNTIPSQAFLALGNEILPIGIKGLFFTGILATVMSTLDSNALVSGITLGKDVFGSFDSLKAFPRHRLIKSSMMIVLLFGVITAIWIPSVIDLWYTFGTIAIPALLIPTLFSIAGKPTSRRAVNLNLTLPPIISLLWFHFGKVDAWSYFWGLEPFYPGLCCSMLIFLLFTPDKRES